MRLLGVELTRLRWRRAILVLLAAALLVPLLTVALSAWNTRPHSAAEVRQAEALAAEEAKQGYVRQELRRCERHPGRYGATDGRTCEEVVSPKADWYLYRSALDVDQVLRGEALAVVIFVTGLLMLAATTFVGADWNSGSMSNQLLFEPRRSHIWLSKAGAVSVLGAVGMAAYLAIFWGLLTLLVRGWDAPVPAGFVGDAWAFSGRAVLLCAAACLGAYAVTMLFRSTVFTLGALFAVSIVSVLAFAVLAFSEQWLPHLNVAALLYDGVNYYRDVPDVCYENPGAPPAGVDCAQYARVSLAHGTTYLGAGLLVAVSASFGSFLRRDVP